MWESVAAAFPCPSLGHCGGGEGERGVGGLCGLEGVRAAAVLAGRRPKEESERERIKRAERRWEKGPPREGFTNSLQKLLLQIP